MILDLNGEALVVRVQGRPLGYRPGLKHTIQFETKVVVLAGCIMLLNDKAQALRSSDFCFTAGLSRFGKIAFGMIRGEFFAGHDFIPGRSAERLRLLFRLIA